MTAENLAADIVSRLPDLARDSKINAEMVVAGLIRPQLDAANMSGYELGRDATMKWVSEECKRVTAKLMEKDSELKAAFDAGRVKGWVETQREQQEVKTTTENTSL